MDETTYIIVAEKHMASFFRIACSIVGNRQDAEDAVQQMLLSAWRYRLKAHPDAEQAWMMRILINECRSLLRRKRRTIPMEEVPVASMPHDAQDAALREAICSLPWSLRTPLLLKYMEGMSEKEVAAAMHIPVSSVKGRLFRARKLLKAQLNEEVES